MKTFPEHHEPLKKLGDILLQIHRCMTDPSLKNLLPGLRKQKFDIVSAHGWTYVSSDELVKMINESAQEAADQKKAQKAQNAHQQGEQQQLERIGS